MRLFLCRLSAVMLFGIAACTQSPSEKTQTMTLERLLELHADARGGKAALESVNAVDIRINITEPTFVVEGHYRASREGRMRIDIFADGQRVFTEAMNVDKGWQMFGDSEIADLSAEGEAALRRGIESNLYALHELPTLGYKLELLGETQRNGSVYWEVERTAPDGFSDHLFLEKASYLIASSIETSALHPDLDSTQVRKESLNSDFQEQDGIVFSRRSDTRNIETGEVVQTIIVTARTLNPTLDPAQFERPAQE